MGVRLPCAWPTTTRYSFGDDAASLGEFAWYARNSGNRTHPVGEKRPNGFGVYDMHGNVWEWCWDGYGDYKESRADDPLAWKRPSAGWSGVGAGTAARSSRGLRTGAGTGWCTGTSTWASAWPEFSPSGKRVYAMRACPVERDRGKG